MPPFLEWANHVLEERTEAQHEKASQGAGSGLCPGDLAAESIASLQSLLALVTRISMRFIRSKRESHPGILPPPG